MPSTELRRRLRAAGHALSPVVQVGKLGTTNAVIDQLTQALRDHELIKVKIGTECPETRFEVAEVMAGHPGVNVVQILGRTLLLYQRHPKKPKFEAAAVPETTDAPRPRRKSGKSAKKSR